MQRILYQYWLSPYCRKVRFVLAEKKLDVQLQIEKIWERRVDFLKLNPSGEIPVLVDENGTIVCDSQAICEYLDEHYPEVNLIGHTAPQRAETRRLVAWFDRKFNEEVTEYLIGEKLMKRVLKIGQPDGQRIRAGHQNIHMHLDYIGYLTDRRRWLAGNEFSLADIAAASHLSAIDYIGDVPWDDHKAAREWYARIKSRPSFRPLLEDNLPGTAPAKHYADLDF